jgi:arsenite methyltransferase
VNTVPSEEAVQQRYSAGAQHPESELCCPVSYNPRLLEAIPREVVDRDYGCGDPSRYVRAGEVVLDLGSGAGKACFITSQVVGPQGRVIGVDMNDDMLQVARRNAPEVAARIGYGNVEFKKGKIQDLALDLEKLGDWLREHPVGSVEDLAKIDAVAAQLRLSQPLICDESINVVVSNCVLNLVRPEDKQKLFAEIFRVLRRGGRAVISDIVSDEDVPVHLQTNPVLWSGCISGAFREDQFLEQIEAAGFYGITVLERQEEPWQTVEGIEFRSITVAAYKGKQGPCWDRKQAVIYRGPFQRVEDDDGHVLCRGARTAVCDKTFQIYSQEPYRSQFVLVSPNVEVRMEDARPFPCAAGELRRDPRETKGEDYSLTTEPGGMCCAPENGGENCC